MTESIPVLLEQGWTYLVPTAADTLADALMRLSRPSEILFGDRRERQQLDLVDLDQLLLEALGVETVERSFARLRPRWCSSPIMVRFSWPVSRPSTVASCAARPRLRRTETGSHEGQVTPTPAIPRAATNAHYFFSIPSDP